MIRKKGSLIIENMLSSAMIIILILGICQVIVSKDKWHEIKNKEDEFTRITYAVEEELKYNLSIEEIKNLANSNVISLSKDNILKCLTTEGLEMIFTAYTNTGDKIICENPTHNTAIKIMKVHGLDVVGVSMTEDGIDVDELEKKLKNNL